ncbi:MAG: hypothetical protein AAF556_12235 [Pseudomonadota bacterium]
MVDKPKLAIFHALARTGCTIFSRYLGAMDGVVLLSEIHPMGPVVGQAQITGNSHLALNAVVQATAQGLNILDEPEQLLSVGEQPNSVDIIGQVAAVAAQQSQALVLRDWSHLDWHGKPFCEPTGGGQLVAELATHYELTRAVWARHPLACYMSLVHSEKLAAYYRPDGMFEAYIEGWLGFIGDNPVDRLVRYEDFLPDPGGSLSKMCGYLGLTFDPNYAAKARTNRNITGDDRAKAEADLSLFQRPMPKDFFTQVLGNSDYRQLVAALGYDPEQPPLGYVLTPQ